MMNEKPHRMALQYKRVQFNEVFKFQENGFPDEDLIVFSNSKDDTDIWFLAIQICKMLELKNCSQSLSRIAKGEKDYVLFNKGASTRKCTMVIVSQLGMNQLMLLSKKPVALRYKKWLSENFIFTELIP